MISGSLIDIPDGIYPSAIALGAIVRFVERYLPVDWEDTNGDEIDQAIKEAPPHIKRLGNALNIYVSTLHEIDQQSPTGQDPFGDHQSSLVQQLPSIVTSGDIPTIVDAALTAYMKQHQPQVHEALVDREIAQELGLEPKALELGQDGDSTPENLQTAMIILDKAMELFEEFTGEMP